MTWIPSRLIWQNLNLRPVQESQRISALEPWGENDADICLCTCINIYNRLHHLLSSCREGILFQYRFGTVYYCIAVSICFQISWPLCSVQCGSTHVLLPMTLLMFIWTVSCFRLMANTTKVSHGDPCWPAALPFLLNDGVEVFVTESICEHTKMRGRVLKEIQFFPIFICVFIVLC